MTLTPRNWVIDWLTGVIPLLGDENPEWTADRIGKFLALDDGIPAVDLSVLKNKVTLV